MKCKMIAFLIFFSLLSPLVVQINSNSNLNDISSNYTGNSSSNDCYTGVDAADNNMSFPPTWIANGSNLSTVGGTCSGTLNGTNDLMDKYRIYIPSGKYLDLSFESSEIIYVETHYCTNQTGNCPNNAALYGFSWAGYPNYSEGKYIEIESGTNYDSGYNCSNTALDSISTGYSIKNGEWIVIIVEAGLFSTPAYEFSYNLTFTYHNLSELPPHPIQNDYGSGQDAGMIGMDEYELEINLSTTTTYNLSGWSHGYLDIWDVISFNLPVNYGFDAILTLESLHDDYEYWDDCEADGGTNELILMSIHHSEREILRVDQWTNTTPIFQFNESASAGYSQATYDGIPCPTISGTWPSPWCDNDVRLLPGNEVKISLRQFYHKDINGTPYNLLIDIFSIDDDGDGWDNFLEADCGSNSTDNNSVPEDLDNDGLCNALDDDDDGDGYLDENDNFPNDATDWEDSDGDGVGDNSDSFPQDPYETTDYDNDGIGDNGDEDDDGDGWTDYEENQCYSNQYDSNSTPNDIDNDGVCDDMDSDSDGDGYSNADEINNCGENNDHLDDADHPTDTDGDMLCDAVDTDDDNDGWSDLYEQNCLSNQSNFNDIPLDTDSDGICDEQDLDDDNDGYHDGIDDLPMNSSEWYDTDADGIGNNADDDDDGDGWPDTTEMACGGFDPLDSISIPSDNDDDGICDVMDLDDDNDSFLDYDDEFPFNPTEWVDNDGDGMGDNIDPDDDNDLVPDIYDDLPYDSSDSVDTDQDGIGNNLDDDDDGDGWTDSDETECGSNSLDSSSEPNDVDGDYICNLMDEDDDGDGYLDSVDLFPLDSKEWLDFDGDGLGDNSDGDDDNDGLSDETELIISSDPKDEDTDDDGVIDSLDIFPIDSTEWKDSDGDGIGDNSDSTPEVEIEDAGGLPGFSIISGMLALVLGATRNQIRRN